VSCSHIEEDTEKYYVKLTSLKEAGLQSDSLPKERLKSFSGK